MASEGGFAQDAMLNLSQTTGGKLSTAFDNLKVASAALGAEMLPTVNKLVERVIVLAKAFTALDSSTQRNIVNVGAFAAAGGPLLSVIAKMIRGYKSLTKAMQASNLAQKSSGIGLIITGLALAASAYFAFTNKVKEAVDSVDDFNDRLDRTAEKLDTLNFKALVEEATKAVDRIQTKFAIFSQKEWIDRTTNLTDVDKLKSNNARFLKEVERLEIEIAERLEGPRDGSGRLKKIFGYEKALEELAAYKDAVEVTTAAIESSKKEPVKVIKPKQKVELTDLEKLLARVAEQKARISAVDLFTPDELEKQRALAAALHDAAISAQLLGAEDLARQYEAEADAADDLVTSLEKANAERLKQIDLVNQYGSSVNGLLSALGSYGVVIEENKQKETEAIDTTEAFSNMLVQGSQAIGGAVTSVNDSLREQQSILSEQFAQGELTAEEYHDKLAELDEQAKHQRRSAVMEAIGQMLVQATAQAITNAYQSAAATGPAAAAMGPILAGAAVAGLTSMWAASFARGGMVTGETLAVVGDNQSGKEAIIPFERMGEFLGKFGGGGAQHIVVSGKLSGSDILLSAERSKRSVQRTTGVTF